MIKTIFLGLITILLVSCGGGSSNVPPLVIGSAENAGNPNLSPTCGVLQPEEICETFFFPTGTAVKREYILNIPDTVTEPNPPLFILLHGGGGNAGLASLPFGIRRFIKDNKYIGVFPNARINDRGFRSWNFDDVEFITEVIRQLIVNQNVNPKKVYIFGFSNGSFLANLLACKIPDKITAVIGLAGTLLEPLTGCANTGDVAIHNIHATGDDVIPYIGVPDRFLGAIDAIEEWRIQNQCSATFTTSNMIDLTRDVTGDDASTRTYDNCTRTVELTTIEGSGHLPEYNFPQLHGLMIDFINKAQSEVLP